jgi:hypothetical protein
MEYITVGKMREWMAEAKDSDVVILSTDSEGNDFSPLLEWGARRYQEDTDAHGQTLPTEEEMAEFRAQGVDEDDLPEEWPHADTYSAFVLWPRR